MRRNTDVMTPQFNVSPKNIKKRPNLYNTGNLNTQDMGNKNTMGLFKKKTNKQKNLNIYRTQKTKFSLNALSVTNNDTSYKTKTTLLSNTTTGFFKPGSRRKMIDIGNVLNDRNSNRPKVNY
jgi:hypothetical protein